MHAARTASTRAIARWGARASVRQRGWSTPHLSSLSTVTPPAPAPPPPPPPRTRAPLPTEDESTLDILRAVLAAGKEARAAKSVADPDAAQRLNRESLARLVDLLRPEAPKLAGAVATLGVTTAISLLFPFAIGQVLDVALAPAASSALSPAVVSGGLLALFAVQSSLIVVRSILLTVAGERLSASIRRDLFKAFLSQDAAFFDSHRTGDVISRLSSDTVVLQKALTGDVANGLRSAFMAAGSTGMLVYLSPSLAALSCALIPPIAVAGLAYGRYVQGQAKAVQEALGRTMEVAEEVVGNIRTVRQYTRERDEAARFDERVRDSYVLARRIGVVAAYFDGAVHAAANVGIVAVLAYGGTQIASGALSPGDLTAFLMYSLYTGFNLGNLSRIYTDLKRAAGVASRMFEVCDSVSSIPLAAQPPSIYWHEQHAHHGMTAASTDSSSSSRRLAIPARPTELMRRLEAAATISPNTAQARPSSVAGEVLFNNVSFAYPSRPDVPVLRGLDLRVPAGSHIAIVGASGTGKSTLGALLTRLYDPKAAAVGGDAGAVLLDGVDVRTMDPAWLRGVIGVVPQEPALFALSIADNIRYGCPTATMVEVERAAALANAHEFICRFPEGYGTLVGERGAQLSGGQKQRIAIARAVLKNAPVLVLDEATSALDAESEAGVQDALARLCVGRTTITIAHRLSTIRSADLVAVLVGGRIAESGPFEALYANPESLFRQLVDKQLQ